MSARRGDRPPVPRRRWEALFDWIVRHDPLVDGGHFGRIAEAVLGRYEHDGAPDWNVLEMSVAVRPGRTSYGRFSYGFPRHARDRRSAERGVLQIAEALGPGVPAAAERVLRACRHAAVEQPMIGVALEGAGAERAKLYVQFRSGAAEDARRLSAALLSMDVDALPEGDLHLLGLDLDLAGALIGAKLYHHGAPDPRDPLLAGLPAESLADVLAIRRIETPSAPIGAPTELDFAVGGASVDWATLRGSIAPLAAVGALEDALPLLVRRASLAPGERATAYYLPDVPE